MVVPPSARAAPEASTPFEMAFGSSLRQRRVTVFFRPILAIPQMIVLYFIAIAAFVLVILGWFAALFTGRLPESFAGFILGFLRWRARVDCYVWLMTDKYPPFALQPSAEYPIDVTVQTGRLNRWAVLFRYFIAIPAAIAVALLAVGLSIFWIVTWVATLIKGEVPRTLFEANAAALRYLYRYEAYYFMLTSYYPAEVLGDGGAAGSPPAPPMTPFPPTAPPPPFPPTAPPPAPMAGPEGATIEAPAPAPVPGAYPAPPSPVPSSPAPPPAEPSLPPPPTPPPPMSPAMPPTVVPTYPGPGPATPRLASDWRLILSPGARKLVVTYFIVGALGLVAYIGLVAAITSSSVSTTNQAVTAQNELITAYNLLGRQSQAFSTTTRACPSPQTTAGTQCLAGADAQLAADLQTYQHTVATTDFPAQVASQATAVTSAAAAASAKLEQLAGLGSNPQAYVSAVNGAGLEAAFQQVDSTTRSLNAALLVL